MTATAAAPRSGMEVRILRHPVTGVDGKAAIAAARVGAGIGDEAKKTLSKVTTERRSNLTSSSPELTMPPSPLPDLNRRNQKTLDTYIAEGKYSPEKTHNSSSKLWKKLTP